MELVPANCFDPLDFELAFGRRAPLEVDLGCGDGSFLAAIAEENPRTDFLGVERLPGRVGATCRRIEREGLTNVRVLRLEIAYAVERLFPEGSVGAFHIMFPDPWPKRRHASRRLVTEKFLESLHRALDSGGSVRIATDETGYGSQIRRLISQSLLFELTSDPVSTNAVSKFERRFVESGTQIHRFSLRKVSPVRKALASQ